MEAEVHQRSVRAGPVLLTAWRARRFSVDEARRALPYLARIMSDARTAYRDAQHLRFEISLCSGAPVGHELTERFDAAIRRLNGAIDECNAVGADLLDFERGIVRLGADIGGKNVSLFWQLGDPIAEAWLHECQTIQRRAALV